MRRIAGIVAALLLLLAPSLAQADDERITDYKSDITVARNGVLTVTETIAVIAAGDRIRHGIYRDFPTTYSDPDGLKHKVRFDVEQVTLDGNSEPYDVESIDSGKRVKIGDKDVEVSEGPHTYTITYTTDRQIRFFKDYDELYWNVTGNFWIFDIDRAQATIHLPPGAQIGKRAWYTGGTGSTRTDARVVILDNNNITIQTTVPLSAEEGLTVAVAFNKGIVLPPTDAEKRADFMRDNAGAMIALAGLLILLIYFGVTWFEHGRDPRRGTVIPLFAPPQGFSPAATRYVWKMHYDRKVFAASLIDMAVKGYMKITQAGSTYTLTRNDISDDKADLSSGERRIAAELFDGPGDTIELKQDNHSVIARAITALKSTLASEDERVYFINNTGWFAGGVAIFVITTLLAAVMSDIPGGGIAIVLPLAGIAFLLSMMFRWVFTAWGMVSMTLGIGSFLANAFQAIFTTVFAFVFAGAFSLGFGAAALEMPPLLIAAIVLGAIACAVFYHLLKAPTALGAKTLDQIEGFRMFLNTAEKDRLEALNPPQVTPAVFEKFLPYAIALDCENQWSKKFEAEAAAAGMTPNQSGGYYTPYWYSGGNYGNFGSGFAAGLGASLAASAASAATAPSSSGSGGGGFSGGGGGGGGGGGW